MDKDSRGLWLCPTRGRVNTLLPQFLAAAKATGISTPGALLVNDRDYAQNQAAYDALDLPNGWFIHVCTADDCGTKTQEGLHELCDGLDWIGIAQDDLIPKTHGWDLKLLESATGWNFVSCDDGHNAPKRMSGAFIWSGDLIRAVGYLFPEGMKHFFQDDIWEDLGRLMNVWVTRMDVLVYHANAAWTPGGSDKTTDLKNSGWEHDERLYNRWRNHERLDAANRIGQVLIDYGVSKPMPDLSHIRLMIATPCGDGRYERVYQSALFNTFELLRQCKASVNFGEMPYCSDIVLARTKLFGMFLRSEATHVLFIDSDMGWAPQDVVKLLAYDRDFVAVAGPRKVYPPSFAVQNTNERGQPVPLTVEGDTGLVDVSDIGMAFSLLSRRCCERMRDAYQDELAYNTNEGATEYAVFLPTVVNKRYRSEDFSFCYRWRKIGGRIYCDSAVSLAHIGAHEWKGDWFTHLTQTTERHPLAA